MGLGDGYIRTTATAKTSDDACQIINMGESEKLMVLDETRRNSQVCIELEDLSYSVSRRNGTEKSILRNVTGCFEPGKFTVIVGPSGAGKTTLLKIVSQGLLNIEGTVLVNGTENNREILRKHLHYVPQQFELLPFLTTKETLYIATRLKLDADRSKQEINVIINNVARNLGLSDCLDTSANKLSGGERKRLSIGLEMITNPSVLLLDEPTSGLDSAASNQLINILHNMAKTNCTVICAIHQPSSQMISHFDNIMVLNRGKCMYCGPTSEILDVYSKAGFTCPAFYNIAEFVLEVITEQRNGDLENLYKICREEYEKYRARNENLKPINGKNSKIAPEDFLKENVLASDTKRDLSTWQQQKILFLRAVICIKRDNFLTQFRFWVHVVVALLLGMVFYNFGNDAEKVQSNIACLFFFLMFLFFANAMPVVQMFPAETAVFLQEHLNNWYYLRSYYSVKILTDLPLQILCSSCFMFITYYLTGQPMICDRILQAWSVCVLITILGQTVGILTGAAFRVEIGIFLIPALSIPLLLFAGFFLKVAEMPVYLQPISTISFFRYAFEGIMQAIYHNDRPKLLCSEVYCHFRSPSYILSLLDIPTMSFHLILMVLGAWILCLHVIAYGVLYWKIYSRQNNI